MPELVIECVTGPGELPVGESQPPERTVVGQTFTQCIVLLSGVNLHRYQNASSYGHVRKVCRKKLKIQQIYTSLD